MKWIVFLALSIASSLYDLRCHKAPNFLTLGGLILGLSFSAFEGPSAILASVAGATTGAVLMWLARLMTRGGLGLGDLKFAACIGSFLGPRELLMASMAAAFIALLFALSAVLVRRFPKGTKIPFVPFLALGSAAALFVKSTTFYHWMGIL